jgi:hypothetical protein
MPRERLLGRRLGLAQGAFTVDRCDLRIVRSRAMSVQGTIRSYAMTGHNGFRRFGVRREAGHRGLRFLHGIVVVVVLAVGLPAKVTAMPGYEVRPGGVRVVVPVQHSGNAPLEHIGDYVVAVTAQDHQHVQLTVETPTTRTDYRTRGHVSRRRIEARFGTLGRVDLRLRLTPRPAAVHTDPRCKGPAPVHMEGTYSGVIAFASVEGLPELFVNRGHVYFAHRFKRVCKRRHLSSRPTKAAMLARRSEVGLLAVDGNFQGRIVSLEGSVLTMKGHPAHTIGRLIVVVREWSNGVRITATTNLPVDHKSFAMSEADMIPETVEVAPPMPFAGRALYVRSPGSPPSWTGDLSISLPDSDRLPLAGPGFRAAMCRSSWMTRFRHCRML